MKKFIPIMVSKEIHKRIVRLAGIKMQKIGERATNQDIISEALGLLEKSQRKRNEHK